MIKCRSVCNVLEREGIPIGLYVHRLFDVAGRFFILKWGYVCGRVISFNLVCEQFMLLLFYS